ncbi:MAG TPA: hypothetical protein VJ623_10265 [Holophagaceae bacterium]|nr:hypothetical protein [Holophagaceae bacterium]
MTYLNATPQRRPSEPLDERAEAMHELERRAGAEEGMWATGDGGGACGGG